MTYGFKSHLPHHEEVWQLLDFFSFFLLSSDFFERNFIFFMLSFSSSKSIFSKKVATKIATKKRPGKPGLFFSA